MSEKPKVIVVGCSSTGMITQAMQSKLEANGLDANVVVVDELKNADEIIAANSNQQILIIDNEKVALTKHLAKVKESLLAEPIITPFEDDYMSGQERRRQRRKAKQQQQQKRRY